MTGLAAKHMGIGDGGAIRPGAQADLVLFDPRTVSDRATVEQPDKLSEGIERVWVNGQLVFEAGRSSGRRPGMVIRRTKAATADD
jgi:N-acyl-D-amino-acid deacylase